MNQLEGLLINLSNNHGDTEYMNYLDVTSFAKIFIANQVFMNFDPNRYYVLPSRQSKLKMMPMWDSEWSMGLWLIGWPGNPYPIESNAYWENMYFFKYLLKSPTFKKAVKEEWAKFKDNVQEVKNEVETVRQMIVKAQAANFERWPSPGRPLNVKYNTWEEEAKALNQFLQVRMEWMENRITGWK
jgi:hypothetical protein